MIAIIGLDGATWDLAEPFLAAGDMPTLAALRRAGAHGVLRSTIPPVTFPAWSSFMTGTNPGKHGIFDFTRRVPGTYEVAFVGSRDRRMPTMWKLLSDAGRRVAVIGVPTTYPPEPVNGIMVGGFDSPVATGIDGSFVHPRAFYDEMTRRGRSIQRDRLPGAHHRAWVARRRAPEDPRRRRPQTRLWRPTCSGASAGTAS